MQIEGNKLTAEEGKIIARKEDNEIVGKVLYLGNVDSIDNYVEIDEPIKEEENEIL